MYGFLLVRLAILIATSPACGGARLVGTWAASSHAPCVPPDAGENAERPIANGTLPIAFPLAAYCQDWFAHRRSITSQDDATKLSKNNTIG